jgi:hypothetical protein
MGTGNDFLNRTPTDQKIRTRIDKWDCIQLKSFCTAKETISRMKRQPTEWEKIQWLSIQQGINIQNT